MLTNRLDNGSNLYAQLKLKDSDVEISKWLKITRGRGGKDCGKVKVDVKRIGYLAPVEKPKSPVIEVKIA